MWFSVVILLHWNIWGNRCYYLMACLYACKVGENVGLLQHMEMPSITAANKLKLLDAIRSGKAFTLTDAAKLTGVNRYTAWCWVQDDPDFREQWDRAKQAVYDDMLDACERGLMENVAKGDNTAMIFMLKSQGKLRGFGDKLEINHNVTHTIDIDEAARRISFALNAASERGQIVDGSFSEVVALPPATPALEVREAIGARKKHETKQGKRLKRSAITAPATA